MNVTREWEVYPRKRADDYRIGVVYPAPYFVGMSNLGLQWLLRRVDLSPGFCAERFFWEPGASTPPLSLETGRPVADFHLLAFSISFELDYLNVIRFLATAGLPVLAAERDRRHPLVVAGGAALQLNPEPLAPFIDLMVLGEAETALPRLLEEYAHCRDRDDLADRLDGEPYFYFPGRFEPEYDDRGALRRLRRRGETGEGRRPPAARLPFLPAESLALAEPAFSNIITDRTEFARTMLVEIARGCPAGCRYCWAGQRYLPARRHPAASVLELAERARPRLEKIGLVATAVCAHPEILPLLRELRRMGLSVGLSSLRLPDITPELLQLLAEGGEDTITLAPETGSDALRRRLNKNFGNDELLHGLELARRAGLSHFRLYFMVGLPGETAADLAAAVDLVARIRLLLDGLPAPGQDGARLLAGERTERLAQDGARLLAGERSNRLANSRGRLRARTGARLSATVTPFVPRPNTPFQFAKMDEPGLLKRKMGQLAAALGRMGVTVHPGAVRAAWLQWRIGVGTRRLAGPLREAAAGRLSLQELLRRPGVEGAWFEPSDEAAVPPWAVLDWGLDSGFLRAEWERFRAGETTAPCPGRASCRRCGICGE